MKCVRSTVTVPGIPAAPAAAAGLAVVSALLVLAPVRPAWAQDEIRIVREPVFVDLSVGSFSTVLREAPDERAELVARLAGEAADAAAAEPGRLIVLRFVDLPLEFAPLPETTRTWIRAISGGAADPGLYGGRWTLVPPPPQPGRAVPPGQGGRCSASRDPHWDGD